MAQPMPTNVRYYCSASGRFVKKDAWTCSTPGFVLKLCSGIPMPLGGLVTLFVLLPNLLVVLFPPASLPEGAGKKPAHLPQGGKSTA
jgi:hypothetical protein